MSLSADMIAAAQGGDENAFASLIETYRGELRAHCYRMLGSVHEAEDALQEASIRALRALPKFEGRSSLRSWLYTIATNVCLNQISRRPKRMLPMDYAPAVAGDVLPGEPITESVWIEPYPDEQLEVQDGFASPDARYEQRESIELAFIAALQHLPANQRAALILREVLGFSAKETAETLETTVASVNSALQRARASIDEKLPDPSQQSTLRALGDDGLRAIVDRYVAAWERADIDAIASMLAADATFAMPPLATWYSTREGIRTWMAASPLSGQWRWKGVRTQANGQPALAFYSWDDGEQAYLRFALNVLSFRGAEISSVTAFIVRTTEPEDPDAYVNYPDQEFDAARVAAAFDRFGMPERLAP